MILYGRKLSPFACAVDFLRAASPMAARDAHPKLTGHAARRGELEAFRDTRP